jgi:hypothetical protein
VVEVETLGAPLKLAGRGNGNSSGYGDGEYVFPKGMGQDEASGDVGAE